MATDDLELEERVVDIVGLYLHPLQHAAVFSVAERTTIRVPDQSGSVLPESWFHGTLSLSTAFDKGVGEASDNIASQHTSAEFNAFLTGIVASQPRGKEIHVVADNVSAHRTVQVNEFLRTHRTVHLQFFPSYSSWLIQFEQWLSKIERDIDACAVPISGADLKRKLMRHIRHCKRVPKAVKWKYFDPVSRLTTDIDSTVH
jgi:transposase